VIKRLLKTSTKTKKKKATSFGTKQERARRGIIQKPRWDEILVEMDPTRRVIDEVTHGIRMKLVLKGQSELVHCGKRVNR